MTEPPTHETDEVLAAIDDQELAALVNAAFAMEVNLAHHHAQGKGASSPHPDADTRK